MTIPGQSRLNLPAVGHNIKTPRVQKITIILKKIIITVPQEVAAITLRGTSVFPRQVSTEYMAGGQLIAPTVAKAGEGIAAKAGEIFGKSRVEEDPLERLLAFSGGTARV